MQLKMRNICMIWATIFSAGDRLYELHQLDRRKFTEPLEDVLLLPLEKHPTRRLVLSVSHEVHPAPDRFQLGIRLEFEVHVPAALPALQLTHVTGAVLSRKRLRHIAYATLSRDILPAS